MAAATRAAPSAVMEGILGMEKKDKTRVESWKEWKDECEESSLTVGASGFLYVVCMIHLQGYMMRITLASERARSRM